MKNFLFVCLSAAIPRFITTDSISELLIVAVGESSSVLVDFIAIPEPSVSLKRDSEVPIDATKFKCAVVDNKVLFEIFEAEKTDEGHVCIQLENLCGSASLDLQVKVLCEWLDVLKLYDI